MTSSARLASEQAIVAAKFPANTKLIHVGRYSGWAYDFTCEYGNAYTMFAFRDDDSLYKVKMVWPDPKEISNPHKSHYFRDGTICLTERIGYPSLEHAYAKSVLFATAWSAYEVTGQFVF